MEPPTGLTVIITIPFVYLWHLVATGRREKTMPDKCRGCGAPVKWIVMISGKHMICEAEPVKACCLSNRVDENIPFIYELKDVYIPHWGNCPNADDFKKRIIRRPPFDGKE